MRVGPKLSAWFLALFGLKDFRDAKQAAAFLGLFLPAIAAARYNADIRALYERLIAAGKCKTSALGAAMRKLVHLAWPLCRQ